MVVGLLKMDRNELGASLTSRQNEKNFFFNQSSILNFVCRNGIGCVVVLYGIEVIYLTSSCNKCEINL